MKSKRLFLVVAMLLGVTIPLCARQSPKRVVKVSPLISKGLLHKVVKIQKPKESEKTFMARNKISPSLKMAKPSNLSFLKIQTLLAKKIGVSTGAYSSSGSSAGIFSQNDGVVLKPFRHSSISHNGAIAAKLHLGDIVCTPDGEHSLNNMAKKNFVYLSSGSFVRGFFYPSCETNWKNKGTAFTLKINATGISQEGAYVHINGQKINLTKVSHGNYACMFSSDQPFFYVHLIAQYYTDFYSMSVKRFE